MSKQKLEPEHIMILHVIYLRAWQFPYAMLPLSTAIINADISSLKQQYMLVWKSDKRYKVQTPPPQSVQFESFWEKFERKLNSNDVLCA